MITLPQGPQFRKGKAAALFLILFVFIIYAAYLISVVDIYELTIILPIIIILSFIILDFQGIEIDKSKGLIRRYKVMLWVKYGKWYNIESFHSIYLDYETYNIKSVSFYSESNYSNEKNGHFIVKLLSSNINNIVLAEKHNYKEASIFANSVSTNLKIIINDNYKTRLQNSNSRRRG